MKMAKASKDDLDRVQKFFELIEEVVEWGTYAPDSETETKQVDDEQLVDLIRKQWGLVGPSWRRVVYSADILIRSCCDPDSDTLEWRPDLRTDAGGLP